jgi:hypothetical protein
MFYGEGWEKVIIGRPELWVEIRSDPTCPQRGSLLEEKHTSGTRTRSTLPTHIDRITDCSLNCR